MSRLNSPERGRISVETRNDASAEKRQMQTDSREIPKFRLPDLESVDEPEVLRVPISVLVGPESVGNTLEGVNDGAGEIVRGVGEVLGSEEAKPETRRIKVSEEKEETLWGKERAQREREDGKTHPVRW